MIKMLLIMQLVPFISKQATENPESFTTLFPTEKIETFVNGYPVNPGGKRRIPAEILQRTVNLNEHFLRNIFGISGILKKTKGCVVNPVLIVLNNLPESYLILIVQIAFNNASCAALTYYAEISQKVIFFTLTSPENY
jgi:hypothetical protein